MNRLKQTRIIVALLGSRNYSWLQEKLKFFLNFRKEYSLFAPKIHTKNDKKIIVFNVDGKTAHGGLSDRFRGLFASYYYAQKIDADFKVIWEHPFLIEDYLQPATFDWRADKSKLSHNFFEVGFRFQNDYSRIANDEETFFKLMKSPKPELHVYINTTIHEELYGDFFAKLFRPSKDLQSAMETHLRALGGAKEYVSMSFRFIGILGDFKDHDQSRIVLTDENEKRTYIEMCLHALNVVHRKHSDKKILVTTDSPMFMQEACNLPFVYVVPGTIDHIDSKSQKKEDVFLKTFLDFMMIVNAFKCYAYTTGEMFGQTKFARTAALCGNNEYKILKEVDIRMIEKEIQNDK